MPTTVAPLSFAQQRLWFFDQLAPGSPLYNVPFVLELDGPLDVPAFERSIDEIVRRHDSLRTTFPVDGGEPVQRIETINRWALAIEDLSGLPPAERERLAESRVLEQIQRPFDLARGPLFRAAASPPRTRTACARGHRASHRLRRVVSWRILPRVPRSLRRVHRGAAVPSAAAAVQYADFAGQQREWMTGDVLEKQLAYWKDICEHRCRPSFPSDRPCSTAGAKLSRTSPPGAAHRHAHAEPAGSQRSFRRHVVHHAPGGICDTSLPAHGAGRSADRYADRQPHRTGIRAAHRFLRQYAGAASGRLRTALVCRSLSRAKHVAFAARAPGSALRAHRRRTESGTARPGQAPMLQTLLSLDNTPHAVAGRRGGWGR